MKLRALAVGIDAETAHRDADEILLGLLDDPEIREAFEAVPRGYDLSALQHIRLVTDGLGKSGAA